MALWAQLGYVLVMSTIGGSHWRALETRSMQQRLKASHSCECKNLQVQQRNKWDKKNKQERGPQ